MDRQAFKQRMQNLKSYRENNPGKGYWDWKVEAFADGGEVGDPEKERFYQATGRSSSGRPLEEGLKPVFSLEDAANMTPIGDAISAKDAYDAVKNRDWLGAGLAALTVVPFVPNAIKRVTPTVRRTGTDQIDRILRAQNKEAKMATRLNNETYPTEQKAYMNQLREFMYTNKMIDTRDQVVTPSLIKTALDKLPKGMDSIKKASDQFKSLKSYTKWFNTVPLLGVGAIGANKYFTNNESRN